MQTLGHGPLLNFLPFIYYMWGSAGPQGGLCCSRAWKKADHSPKLLSPKKKYIYNPGYIDLPLPLWEHRRPK